MGRNNLGMVLLRLGRLADAEPLFREAYTLGQEVLPPELDDAQLSSTDVMCARGDRSDQQWLDV